MKDFTAVTSSKRMINKFASIKNQITRKHLWELIRFILMGGIGASSYLFFSNLYNWLGAPTYLSPLYAWVSGLLIVYFGHMKFTYRVKAQHKRMAFRFLVMQSYNLGMSTISTVMVRDLLHFPYFVASIVALITTVPLLYVLGKYWVYNTNK